MYTTDRFLQKVYESCLPEKTLANVANDDFLMLQQQKREQLKQVLALEKLERFEHSFNYQKSGLTDNEFYTVEAGIAGYLPEFTAPLYILRPKTQPRGVVLYLHGHGNGCFETISKEFAGDYHKNLPLTLVNAGYTVYVPEFIAFGDVICEGYETNEPKNKACYANNAWLLMAGIPLIGVRVYQTLRLIDHMSALEKSEPVVIGISGGGTVTTYTAALGAPMKAACISCYTNTFRGSILSMFHCIDNYISGILRVGEEPEIMSLACPMPLLLTCGRDDPIYPVATALDAINYVREVYEKRQAGAYVTEDVFAGAHEIHTSGIMNWMESLD